MTKESTKVGFSMKNLEAPARNDIDVIREQKEREVMTLPDGRSRRRVGRSEQLALRTFPHIKKLIHDMAEAEGKDYVEIVEDAIIMRDRILRGQA